MELEIPKKSQIRMQARSLSFDRTPHNDHRSASHVASPVDCFKYGLHRARFSAAPFLLGCVPTPQPEALNLQDPALKEPPTEALPASSRSTYSAFLRSLSTTKFSWALGDFG